MNKLPRHELYDEMGETMIALRELSIPSKGQPRGFYLKTYKQAYDIVKPYLGDMLRWDASVRGREDITMALQAHQQTLQYEINRVVKRSITQKVVRKASNERIRRRNEVIRERKNAKHVVNGVPISAELSFNYIKGDPDTIDELKRSKTTGAEPKTDPIGDSRSKRKKLIFNSTKGEIKRDIQKVINKFIDSLGGEQYVFFSMLSTKNQSPSLPTMP